MKYFLKAFVNFILVLVIAHLIVWINHYLLDWQLNAENVIGTLIVYLLMEHMRDKKNWIIF